jgi:hypothetical protein
LSPADDTTETEVVLPLMLELLRILCEPDTVVAGMSAILGIAGAVFFTTVFTDSSNRGSSCSRARNGSLAGPCFLRFCPEWAIDVTCPVKEMILHSECDRRGLRSVL